MNLLSNICLVTGIVLTVLWFMTRAKSQRDGDWQEYRGGAYIWLAIYVGLILAGMVLPIFHSVTRATSVLADRSGIASDTVSWIHKGGALLCALLAASVGAWRTYCSFWASNLISNTPAIWQSGRWRLFSWLVVTLASLYSAGVGASLVPGQEHPRVVWWVSFIVLLGLRWFVSAQIGGWKAGHEFSRLHTWYETEKAKKN